MAVGVRGESFQRPGNRNPSFHVILHHIQIPRSAGSVRGDRGVVVRGGGADLKRIT